MVAHQVRQVQPGRVKVNKFELQLSLGGWRLACPPRYHLTQNTELPSACIRLSPGGSWVLYLYRRQDSIVSSVFSGTPNPGYDILVAEVGFLGTGRGVPRTVACTTEERS